MGRDGCIWVVRSKGTGHMVDSRRSRDGEVEELLRNAELRDELEPFYDESISRVNVQHWPLAARERIPRLDAGLGTGPGAADLPLVRAGIAAAAARRAQRRVLHEILWDVIHKLYEKRIVLDFTDHLTDRELYCLIYRDILPSREKKIDSPETICTGTAPAPAATRRSGFATTPRKRSATTGPRRTTCRCPSPASRRSPANCRANCRPSRLKPRRAFAGRARRCRDARWPGPIPAAFGCRR